MSTTDTNIESRVIETRLFDWRTFKFIQQDNFKEQQTIDQVRLKQSLITNNFIQPFYAWEHNGNIYCLDGKHRSLALESLIFDGKSVPDQLPTTFLKLDSMEQAAKMVLLFSSHYASITQTGLNDFISLYDLDFDKLLDEISLPDLTAMEQIVLPVPEDLLSDGRNKPATMKITFESADELEKAMPIIEKLLNENFKTAFFSVSSGEI